ncbi:MAG TPA: hypothetical protein VMW16_11125 [Sedimentisphaerales bacterium]|nr:hypothetical protein [Sedimentisphaerales bacterium]
MTTTGSTNQKMTGEKVNDSCKNIENGCQDCYKEEEAFVPFAHGNVKKVNFVYTYKCLSSCDHCCFECSPTREETLGFEAARKCIIDAAEKNCKYIGFTGGECLLFTDDTVRLVREASSLGLEPGITTNAYWAITTARTRELTELLVDAGLKNIIISADPFHQKFIALDNVHRAIDELLRCKVHIQIEMHMNGLRDTEFHKMRKEFQKYLDNNTSVTIRVGHSAPCGRWEKHRYRLPHVCRDKIDVCKLGFDITIFPNGDVFPCCSGMINELIKLEEEPSILWLGNVHKHPLSEIIECAEMSPILNALRITGPNGLLDIWGSNGIADGIPLRFCGMCDLCIAISKVLPKRTGALLKYEFDGSDENIRLRLQQSWNERLRLFPHP